LIDPAVQHHVTFVVTHLIEASGNNHSRYPEPTKVIVDTAVIIHTSVRRGAVADARLGLE